MKRISLLCYVTGISLGTVLVNCQYGVNYIQKISGKLIYEADITGGQMMEVVLERRLWVYLLLLFAIYLPVGRWIYTCFLGILGTGLSVGVASMVRIYGMIGIIKSFLGMLPQGLCYIGILYVFGRVAMRKNKSGQNNILIVTFSAILLIVGVYAECYICPYLV